jgi:hypothetical protein
MSASLYWAGGIVVSHLDPSKSWLSGKWFKVIFMIADLISLVIQTIGGGLAGSAAGSKPKPKQLRMGSDIMLAGIIVQLAVMVFYVAYMVTWTLLARQSVKRAGGRMQLMLLALFASSLGIIVRGCYRTPELHEGFKGWIATQQIWMLFDAIPIAFSTFVLKFVRPSLSPSLSYLRANLSCTQHHSPSLVPRLPARPRRSLLLRKDHFAFLAHSDRSPSRQRRDRRARLAAFAHKRGEGYAAGLRRSTRTVRP